MSVAEINRKGSCGDFTQSRVLSLWPWELQSDGADRRVDIDMSFSRAGLYYVQIYLHDKPYSTRSASTQGKIQASGIVVDVR